MSGNDGQTKSVRVKDLDANFIDDEELQAALSRSRRQKVKRAKISPEEIASRCTLDLTLIAPCY